MTQSETTLEDLFPGIQGRMELVRVMLHLRMPQLADLPRDTPLDAEMVMRLETARELVARG
ncbi:MAG: hypothetical protein AAF799_19570 [Myxococcota bacterium]